MADAFRTPTPWTTMLRWLDYSESVMINLVRIVVKDLALTCGNTQIKDLVIRLGAHIPF